MGYNRGMARTLTFTPEQQRVIRHRSGHALVSAVAGSGKSTTMVELVAGAVDDGMDPDRILVIQYNKSAQVSMSHKLRERLPDRMPKARTFHSVGLQMRKKLVELGVLPQARLASPKEAARIKRDALRGAWKQRYGRESYLPSEMNGEFDQFATLVKAGTLSARDVLIERGYPSEYDAFPDAFDRMCRECANRGRMFFDDMLYHPYLALKADPDLWWHFAATEGTGGSAWDLIVVDEFQDANPVQFEILKGLAGLIAFEVPEEVAQAQQLLALAADGPKTSVVAVGDDSQSIYGFRGADVSLINERFAKTFAPCARYPLRCTFRYGHETALLANHIITHNRERDDKITIAAEGNPDTRISRLAYKAKQATGIVKAVSRAHREGKLSKGVMLVRFYSMSIPYEIELLEAGIPFHVYGREPLVLLPEIASLVAVLSLSINHWTVDEEVVPVFLRSLLMMPTLYLSAGQLEDCEAAMTRAFLDGKPVTTALAECARQLPDARLRARVGERASMLQLIERGSFSDKNPGLVLDTYLRVSGFEAGLQRGGGGRADNEEMRRNIRGFTEMVGRYQTIEEVLDTLGPMAAFNRDKPPTHDHLKIMSIHSAKGLEWPTVILPGWVAGVYPRDSEGMEEERRLAYVAVTRAINHLVFVHPEDADFEEAITDLSRAMVRKDSVVSPFLAEGEIGLCKRAAEAIRSFTPTHLLCRRADIVTRYAKEVGCDVLTASVPPDLVQQQAQLPAAGELEGLKLHTELVSPEKEIYVVADKVNDLIYMVTPVIGGESRYICADEVGWRLHQPPA